jgi:predicted nucleotidyltransferase
MRQFAKDYYSPSACLYHYLHMARGNFREYLQGDIVWVKKYFYVLRPLFAMQWIEQGLGIVPTDFNVAVEKLPLDTDLRKAIANLLENKRAGNELDKGEKIPIISNFIESELARWESSEIPKSFVHSHDGKLDDFFRASIKEVW